MRKTLLAVALAPLCLQSQAFAEESSSDEVMVVTANRFEQPSRKCNCASLAIVVTREQIHASSSQVPNVEVHSLSCLGCKLTSSGGSWTE